MALEEVMQHPWVCKRSKELLDKRRKSDDMSKFANFSAPLSNYVPKAPEQ
jgi:hypothetical protein